MPARRPKSSKRPPVQRRSRETVDLLVQTTARILNREGPDALTTNHIAKKAGVSIGSLYQYFPDKQALVDEVRVRYRDDFKEKLIELNRRLAVLSLREVIAECVRVLIALHRDDLGVHNTVSCEGMDRDERRLFQQITASWLEMRRDEVRPSDRLLAAELVVDAGEALIHGVALRAPERLGDAKFAAEITELLTRYLVKTE